VGSKAAGFRGLGYPGTLPLACCVARLAQYQTGEIEKPSGASRLFSLLFFPLGVFGRVV